MSALLFRGRIVHSLSPTELEIISDGLLGVNTLGQVQFLYEVSSLENQEKFLQAEGLLNAEFHQLSPDQFLFPGFIDTHIHAPQYPNAGFGMDLPLLDWLDKYTFPTESSMSDPIIAKDVYARVVQQTLRQGTTMACYYSSIHEEATKILADSCLEAGQRGFIGKCNMDQMSPDHYRETCSSSLECTKSCMQYVKSLDPTGELLTYCLTPRFAPSCSRELMQGLGDLAKSENLPIQTHIAENLAELEMVRETFPEFSDYCRVYDGFGLLTHRTILAHAIYLSPNELSLIRSRGSGISHCPSSNTGISSGECRVREILDLGIKIGLGTDVSGGYSCSILDAAKLACSVSRHRVIHEKDRRLMINITEALYMATLGGAEVCGMQDKLGNFGVGKLFDALVVDLSRERRGRVDIFPGEPDEKLVEKWVFNGDDRNISRIYIGGRTVLSN